ncbi:muscarinic acetylcholine receptor M1-like [Strongylocentrotus purpuratus]|uniref:G-protein coupled receptors family 1 profile domain-containing protein n=1 Tax=Strongylocentrotus purpuratus TaxID=7668 RepID=A0A7M7RDM2_STRPU|nr:muscarinic acetylcholine receptor M1-like [Strongylocentrotus purpuratus]|eukprot:XP_792861.1 PREDICTED: muscarinic acetylcholine receptor M1-like [Strongylocentrotus purpuratus]
MAGAKIQNVSEPTYYLTMSFEDYFANSTEDLYETTITEQKTRSVNIHGILWPILFTVLIIVANFLSLVAFCIEKRLRTYNNYFIINLTILDLITGLFLIPVVVHTHFGYYPFSQDICKVNSAIRSGILNASNLAVVVICADRHRATYDPINHFISRSKRMAVIKNLIPWTVSGVFWFLYSTVPEFIIDFDNSRHCIHWYALRPLPGIIPFITFFYLPFTIIAVLYFRIVAKIQATLGGKNVENQFAMEGANKRKITAELPHDDMKSAVSTATINVDLSSDNLDQGPKMKNDNAANNGEKTTVKLETSIERSKATRTLLVIVIAFVVSWLPQSVIMLIYSIEPVLVVPGLPRPVLLFFGWMLFLNSLLNPISYGIRRYDLE